MLPIAPARSIRLKTHLHDSAWTAVIAAALVAIGCQTPASRQLAAVAEAEAEQSAVAVHQDATQPGVRTVSSAEPVQAVDKQEALNKVMGDLQEIGAIDSAAEEELRKELEAADPKMYPLIVRSFRSALAFREQLAAREAGDSRAYLASHRKELPAAERPSMAESVAMASDGSPAQVPVAPQQEVTDLPAPPRSPERTVAEDVRDVPPPAGAVAAAASRGEPVRPTRYDGVAPVTLQGDPLDAAIMEMQQRLPANPTTTDEVNQYMRLRLLQLAAGRDAEAFQPIPGATAAQHDYWVSQLFALQTYLDASTQPSDKERAAAALLHLDEARARLAELATLRVKNLTLVHSVDGYGSYKRDDRTQFRPGEQVTLYAELENFRSDSTETGYATSLGTSYEVVDQTGRRVDGGQFPDVEDLCQNRRRDFHLQYSVPLPVRIYPGTYHIKLVITDHLSNKIGQAMLPFEIVE